MVDCSMNISINVCETGIAPRRIVSSADLAFPRSTEYACAVQHSKRPRIERIARVALMTISTALALGLVLLLALGTK